jgi:hypothetical protein
MDCQKKVAKIWELRTRNIDFDYFKQPSARSNMINDFQVIDNE